MPTDPLRLDRFPSRRFLNPHPPDPPEVSSFVRQISSLHGVDPGRVLLIEGPGAGLDLAVRTLVAPGERVVLFEPCPADHFRVVIAAGGRTVDAGRRADFRVRADAMSLAVSDGAVGVLLPEPNDPTATSGDVEDVMGVAGDAFVIIDRRCATTVESPPEGAITLVSLAAGAGGPLGALLAPIELVAALGRMRGPLPMSVRSRAVVAQRRLRARRKSGARGRRVARAVADIPGVELHRGTVPFFFVRARGVDGQALADALRGQGLVVEQREHHSTRHGVRVSLPADPDAVRRALLGLF